MDGTAKLHREAEGEDDGRNTYHRESRGRTLHQGQGADLVMGQAHSDSNSLSPRWRDLNRCPTSVSTCHAMKPDKYLRETMQEFYLHICRRSEEALGIMEESQRLFAQWYLDNDVLSLFCGVPKQQPKA